MLGSEVERISAACRALGLDRCFDLVLYDTGQQNSLKDSMENPIKMNILPRNGSKHNMMYT